ncbi:MAG: helix-hairpin-helix domain-containing protein [Thermoguttaceae bacterium]|nr:helix-hairpin-helix domain-containing protein [Thermoguttaceae bacterium]
MKKPIRKRAPNGNKQKKSAAARKAEMELISFDVKALQFRTAAAVAFIALCCLAFVQRGFQVYRAPSSKLGFTSSIDEQRAEAPEALARALDEIVIAKNAPVSDRSRRKPAANSVESSDVKTPITFLVDINSAPKSELTNLPKIGPALAERIIEYRESVGGFATVDDLLEVKGIGEKTLERLRPYCVAGPHEADAKQD